MKVSVIIPTCNRRHLIAEATDSVLSQEGVELELIIVDDGSSDDTLAWLAQTYQDKRIRLLSNQRTKGPAGARNTGILAATGELIAFLDSDDHFLPGHLKEAADLLESQTNIGLVFGRSLYQCDGKLVDYMGPNFELKLAKATIDQRSEAFWVFDDHYTDHLLEVGCYFSLCTVVMRTTVTRALMNEDLRVAEDYEYWVRLSRQHRFACLSRPQSCSVLHSGNISFETQASAAQHAPSQLAAYEIMLAYEGLSLRQVEQIRRNMAEVLFDWAFRCTQYRQWLQALKLHVRSAQLGLRSANVRSLLKLPLKYLGSFLVRRA